MILRIKIDPAMEMKARKAVRARLRARREALPKYRSLWKEVIKKRALSMSLADFLRFWVLHRQFSGQSMPFLPSAVRIARAIVRRVPGLRRRIDS